MPPSKSLQSQVVPRLTGLSPKLRSAAEFVLEHPDEVATRSLRQVARAAGLPPPTFSRLARALDFETYDDLREVCRAELKRRNRVLADKAQALLQMSLSEGPAQRSGMLFNQARAAMENISLLTQEVDLDKLRAAADDIARAPKVVLIGSTSGLALVNYFRCMAVMAFDNWRIAGAGGAMWASELAKLDRKDVVVVVSIRPYGDLPVRAAEFACSAKANVIAITDAAQSPFTSIASTCFIAPTQSPQFFPSHVVPMLLIETLMGMVVRRAGKRAAKHISFAEATGHDLHEYWEDQALKT